MDTLIQRISTALIVTCVVVVAGTLVTIATPWLRTELGVGAVESRAYVAGDTIDLARSWYSSSSRTVFVFASATCGACLRSEGAIATLHADLQKDPDVRVVLVTPLIPSEDQRLFARNIGIDPASVLHTDLGALRLDRVPTFVVTDATGRILESREGVLTEVDRQELVLIARTSTVALH